MRVAILGAGSLGTVIGAMMTKNGVDAVLIDGYKEHVEALQKNGATIVGKLDLQVPVNACDLDHIEGKFEVVFYLGKAPNNSTYLPAILSHLFEDSVVCTLQNGIPEERVARFVGRQRTVGGTVGWGASLKGPGVSEMTSDPNRQTYDLGEMNGEITPRIEAIKALLDKAGIARVSNNLAGERWTKLCVNASFSGMSAALGCTYGEVLDNDRALLCAAFIKDEIIKLAHAQEIKLLELQGTQFEDFELVHGKADFESKKTLYYQWYEPHRKVIASMLFDMRLGRKCEIDAINGEAVEKGNELGIDTPFNDKVVELVKEAESKGIVPDFTTNLERFSILLK